MLEQSLELYDTYGEKIAASAQDRQHPKGTILLVPEAAFNEKFGPVGRDVCGEGV